MAATLGWRALGRATLARQLLLQRASCPAEDAIRRLVGMQSQAPQAPYIGLWSRLEGFQPEELSRLLLTRRVVRGVAMRGTVHLLTADDYLAVRGWVQPLLDRDLRTNAAHARELTGLDLDALAEAGRELVEASPRTMTELGAALRRRWPERSPASLAYAVRDLLALVQLPPRGLWERSGRPVLTTAQAWLRRPLRVQDPDTLVERYLGAFGPASVADAQTWSGLTGLREVFERLPLLRLRDEAGRELFDLPQAPRPPADTPAPVRFLAEFDNLLLSHADRTRVVAAEHWRRIADSRRPPRGALIDGYTRATWQLVRQRGAARLVVEPLVPMGRRDRAAVITEGGALLAFAAPTARSRDVEVLPG